MPNVIPVSTIVFLADNHARSAAGCYGEGAIRTPAIDSIARAGIRFENAYCASPLCCPSRAALATGRYPHQTGFYDNVLAYDGSTPSWMHRARDAGRKVVSVGKLHFRSTDDDNGFSQERIPMHILNGRGGTAMLLRASGGELPAVGQWELYTQQSGVGGSVYQQYDRDITRSAIAWLREQAANPVDDPWILFVSYASPHPPFSVPAHLFEEVDLDAMPLPPAFGPGERSEHPAIVHLRHIMGTRSIDDSRVLKTIAKAYYGLVTHLDRQIGEVLSEVEALGLRRLRLVYTSDHGEMLGAQGLFGKSCVYEPALRVPLVMCGPDIESKTVRTELVSHVDLYPTLLDSVGVSPHPDDTDLPGSSLLGPVAAERSAFAEYHATGSTGGAFVLRDGRYKLIHHVGHESELFDLGADPDETRNLASEPAAQHVLDDLTTRLHATCDPEVVDADAKRAQAGKVAEFGGRETLIREGTLVYTPPPGKAPEVREIQ